MDKCKWTRFVVERGGTDQKDRDHREAIVVKKVDSNQILGQRRELDDPVKKRDCAEFAH